MVEVQSPIVFLELTKVVLVKDWKLEIMFDIVLQKRGEFSYVKKKYLVTPSKSF